MTKDERMAMELSRLLPTMSDEVEQTLMSAHDAIDIEAIDALCYNGLYGAAGKFDGHRYVKQLSVLDNGAVVLRVFLASYYRDQNPDGYARDENGNLIEDENGELIDEWDDPNFDEDDLYFPECNMGEIAQFWFLPNGHQVTLSIGRTEEWYMRDVNGCFTLGTHMEPVDFGYCSDVLTYDYRCYDTESYELCDAELKPNNLQRLVQCLHFLSHNGCPVSFPSLAKAGDYISQSLRAWEMPVMLRNYMMFGLASSAALHFHELKVAHRNGFRAPDEERWLQLLDNITYCNGNTHDPRNFMPVDFDQKYDEWSNHKAVKLRNEARAAAVKLKLDLEEAERVKNNSDLSYMTSKAAYLVIHFGNQDYDFTVLQNVEQFKVIGNTHHQCIFTNGYYRKGDCVMLICTNAHTGEYVSTVQVDIDSFKVVANLGHNNNVPAAQSAINQVVYENMQLFRDARRAMQQCRDERDKRIMLNESLDNIINNNNAIAV